MISLKLNEHNINEFGRYDELKQTVDKKRAKDYFEKIEGKKIIPPKVMTKADIMLRDFILKGGFDIRMPAERKTMDVMSDAGVDEKPQNRYAQAVAEESGSYGDGSDDN